MIGLFESTGRDVCIPPATSVVRVRILLPPNPRSNHWNELHRCPACPQPHRQAHPIRQVGRQGRSGAQSQPRARRCRCRRHSARLLLRLSCALLAFGRMNSDDDLKCNIQRRCPSGLVRAIAFWFFCCILHCMYTPPAVASVAACWQPAHAHASASSQHSHGLLLLLYSISVSLSLRLLQREQLPWSCQRAPSTTEYLKILPNQCRATNLLNTRVDFF